MWSKLSFSLSHTPNSSSKWYYIDILCFSSFGGFRPSENSCNKVLPIGSVSPIPFWETCNLQYNWKPSHRENLYKSGRFILRSFMEVDLLFMAYLISMLIPLLRVVAEWTRLSPYSGCLMLQLLKVLRTWSGFVPKFSLYDGWVMASWNIKQKIS